MERLRNRDRKYTKSNFGGALEGDIFLEIVVDKYRAVVNRAKQYVIDAFRSCDLDGDGTCSVSEFVLLNRYIEHDKFVLNKCIEEFFEFADLDIEGEKNMSFDKFAVVSVEKGFFSERKQNMFIGVVKSEDIPAKFETLQSL